MGLRCGAVSGFGVPLSCDAHAQRVGGFSTGPTAAEWGRTSENGQAQHHRKNGFCDFMLGNKASKHKRRSKWVAWCYSTWSRKEKVPCDSHHDHYCSASFLTNLTLRTVTQSGHHGQTKVTFPCKTPSLEYLYLYTSYKHTQCMYISSISFSPPLEQQIFISVNNEPPCGR